jgi:TIR domain-containing protein
MRQALIRILRLVVSGAALIGASVCAWHYWGHGAVLPRSGVVNGVATFIGALVSVLAFSLVGTVVFVALVAFLLIGVDHWRLRRALRSLNHPRAARRLQAIVFLGRRRGWYANELRRVVVSIVEVCRNDELVEVRVEAITALGKIRADTDVRWGLFPGNAAGDLGAFVDEHCRRAFEEARRSEIRAIRDAAALAASVYAAKERARPEPRANELRSVNSDIGQSPQPDIVDFTVFSSPTLSRGDKELIQVFVHIPRLAREAAWLARQSNETATSRGFRSLEVDLQRGVELVFSLSVPGLIVEDEMQSLTWRGRTDRVQFAVSVPDDCRIGALIGKVTISHDSIPIGQLRFKLSIVEPTRADTRRTSEALGQEAKRYETAFISYASQDRDKVLARVQMLRPLGVRFFQDVLELSPGDRWERQLYRYIDHSDLFLLFWSSAARNSEWVLKEVRYALARKGEDESAPPDIYPVILEGPPIVPPPPELAHLHFEDRLNYFVSKPV